MNNDCYDNQPIRPIVNNVVIPITQVQQTMKQNCGWNYNHERLIRDTFQLRNELIRYQQMNLY